MTRTFYVTGFMLFVSLFSCSNNKSSAPVTQIPTVTTSAISEITQTTAICGGEVISDGGAPVSSRGVCFCPTPIPTYQDTKTCDGTGTGIFLSSITGLNDNTLYYVRAYAVNDAGIGYGSIDSFRTTDSIGTVTDIDGNIYKTVKIGMQWWMAENLKVTHYRNGDSLLNAADTMSWIRQTTGVYCSYNNNDTNTAVYGRLYNWRAVKDSRNIAPDGWHVPSDSDWQILIYYNIGDAAGKMKETGTVHWQWPNTGATNECGFTALPGGYRNGYAFFDNMMGMCAYFWTSDVNGGTGPIWELYYNSSNMYHDNSTWTRFGFSIRCVKD